MTVYTIMSEGHICAAQNCSQASRIHELKTDEISFS